MTPAWPTSTTTARTPILFDSHAPGSGQVFDWSLAEGAPTNRRLILAGGLTPENVADGIAEVRPWGVDVSSGVEVDGEPGRKDPLKVQAFIHAAAGRGAVGRGPGRAVRRTAGRSTGPSRASEPRSRNPFRRTASRGGTLQPVTATMGTPGQDGRFGEFGGTFVPETLVPALQELDRAFREAWADPVFRAELDALLADYAGRPSPLTECHRLGEELGCRLFLKREDLNHTGSHKINNVLGQALLARRMGKRRLVAETGAGQHGVATATAAALMGMDCLVYMGEVDMARQELNVFRMRLLGAEVTPGAVGQPDAEGRGQRGDARLGGRGRGHPLLPRLGDGPAPVPVDGA